MSVAAIGAMSLHQFSEAAGLTFLFSLGEWLESQATHKAKVALESIVNLMPETANKQTISSDNQIDYITVPAESVNVNDIVLVKPGSKIPVDGLILKGTSIINESNLTGESKPVSKTINSPVFSGTINIGSSPIIIKTSKTTKNSTVAKLISLVEEAQSNRSPTEKLIDEFAKCYTPTVLITSLLMCTLPFLIYGKETGLDWFYRGIVLIIIACPCALIISTPVAYVAGLGATAKKGIIVKGGIHLEVRRNDEERSDEH
ncbi:hypothetical protein TL16_g04725 [Triparma laevis f. inornata]|uniref:P-type ATPase A domain-containing protein n=1 Tax=Triparma laevis f. inornata TaxID=1714386 RepID=A0A9W7AE74_9STRA|nr:hypothetical protein TL16_g04725 [Triparma laevis f. inornata]